MKLNEDYINALLDVNRRSFFYNNGGRLPKVAEKFIEMGKRRGIDIEIIYGTKLDDNNIIAGYWIKAPQMGVAIFQQDVYMDDEGDENISAATRWMSLKLDELEKK